MRGGRIVFIYLFYKMLSRKNLFGSEKRKINKITKDY